MGAELLSLLAALAAAGVRGFLALMATIAVHDVSLATAARMLPVLLLPAAALRTLTRGAYGLAAALLCMELYFVFNRLTVFASKPLTWAELIGNVGQIAFALILVTRKGPWRVPAQHRKQHA